jgi:hypothetical protein
MSPSAALPHTFQTAKRTRDTLKRLATASATPFGSGTVSYSKTYNYTSDGSSGIGQFGNMSCTVGISGYCPQVTFDNNTNWIKKIGSLSAGYGGWRRYRFLKSAFQRS